MCDFFLSTQIKNSFFFQFQYDLCQPVAKEEPRVLHPVQGETAPQGIAALTGVFVISTSVSSHNQGQTHIFVSRYFHEFQCKKEMRGNGAQQVKDKIRSNCKVMINVTAPVDIRPCPGSEPIPKHFYLK
jgi:hypothetical protein